MADKCSEGVLRGFGLLGVGVCFGGCFVLGGTRKDFCLSYVNRRALSQSLRIMSITIFYFFWGHRNLTQSTPRSPRETERGTTDGKDLKRARSILTRRYH